MMMFYIDDLNPGRDVAVKSMTSAGKQQHTSAECPSSSLFMLHLLTTTTTISNAKFTSTRVCHSHLSRPGILIEITSHGGPNEGSMSMAIKIKTGEKSETRRLQVEKRGAFYGHYKHAVRNFTLSWWSRCRTFLRKCHRETRWGISLRPT